MRPGPQSPRGHCPGAYSWRTPTKAAVVFRFQQHFTDASGQLLLLLLVLMSLLVTCHSTVFVLDSQSPCCSSSVLHFVPPMLSYADVAVGASRCPHRIVHAWFKKWALTLFWFLPMRPVGQANDGQSHNAAPRVGSFRTTGAHAEKQALSQAAAST